MTSELQGAFDGCRALSFDCYGTLIDWESGIVNALQPWCAGRGIDRSAEELLTLFSANEHHVEAEMPTTKYPDVLAECLRRMAGELGHPVSVAECEEFGASVGSWPAFADSAVALRRLKERYRLVIVSNVDRASFARSNRRLGVEFDVVVTADDAGAYKPRLEHFHAMFDRLPDIGVARNEIVHVAQSLFHDHGPARELGLESVWIDRRRGRAGTGATPPVIVEVGLRFPSLEAFADAVL